jgi:hypothetical protein
LFLKKRTNAWIDLMITVLNVVVWIAFGLWKPYDQRYEYNNFSSPADGFRFSLFVS